MGNFNFKPCEKEVKKPKTSAEVGLLRMYSKS